MAANLSDWHRRRDYDCRLTPDRALESLDEAQLFLLDRGLLTRTADSSLPSLYEACHEPPYRPGGRGFAGWPATKWPWGFELATRPGVHALELHHGKTIMLSGATRDLADPVCRAELARLEAGEAGPEAQLVLRHLRAAGPAMTDDLAAELGLSRQRLKSVRAVVTRFGAVIARPVLVPARTGGELHRTELARWDQAYPDPVSPGAASRDAASRDAASRDAVDVVPLLAAGLRAAVLAPEEDLARWFSWRHLLPSDAGDQLVARGLATRPAPGWLAAVSGAA